MPVINLQLAPSRSTGLIGLVLGILAILVMILVQPLIEPAYVWFEVAVGLLSGFIVAEWAATRMEAQGLVPEWRTYRMLLFWFYVGAGGPIILYEIVNHLVLGRAV
jgi:hypothetical protein